MPDLLYDLLVARLDPTANLIPVATAAAAIGREVDLGLLEAAVDLPSEDLGNALEMLRSQGVLEPKEGDATQYRFRHELLREVAYELQPPSRRRPVHSQSRGHADPGLRRRKHRRLGNCRLSPRTGRTGDRSSRRL